MRKASQSAKKPKIVIGNSDFDRLTRLANNSLNTMPELAEELLTELERAKVVSDRALPENVVRMGVAVTYTSDTGQERTVILVNPGEADIAEGKVSIMTPIGTALIGLAVGQSIGWIARDGQKHLLTIKSVQPLTASSEQ